ncbi:MAG: hypothetical protein IKW36_07150 [Alistipes sp.]|nr:hypothetical protein [Alistipes sp.]
MESNNKLRYVRMETNPWENIDKVICYSDLIHSEDRMWEFFERISHDAENVDSKLVCNRLLPKK